MSSLEMNSKMISLTLIVFVFGCLLSTITCFDSKAGQYTQLVDMIFDRIRKNDTSFSKFYSHRGQPGSGKYDSHPLKYISVDDTNVSGFRDAVQTIEAIGREDPLTVDIDFGILSVPNMTMKGYMEFQPLKFGNLEKVPFTARPASGTIKHPDFRFAFSINRSSKMVKVKSLEYTIDTTIYSVTNDCKFIRGVEDCKAAAERAVTFSFGEATKTLIKKMIEIIESKPYEFAYFKYPFHLSK